jgi:sulfur-carrier protein adenylyltransferase/sulfurtransferase
MGTTNLSVKQISPRELKQRLDDGEAVTLIDVREPVERDICHIGGDLIPKDSVLQHLDRIPREGDVVIYCRSGGRSQSVIQELQTQCGYTNLINLTGGVLRWSDEVDPSVVKY